MAALENKIDFAIAFEVNNANPNGDPLNGNRPRMPILMRTVCAFINLALDMRIGLSVMGVNGVCRLMM